MEMAAVGLTLNLNFFGTNSKLLRPVVFQLLLVIIDMALKAKVNSMLCQLCDLSIS